MLPPRGSPSAVGGCLSLSLCLPLSRSRVRPLRHPFDIPSTTLRQAQGKAQGKVQGKAWGPDRPRAEPAEARRPFSLTADRTPSATIYLIAVISRCRPVSKSSTVCGCVARFAPSQCRQRRPTPASSRHSPTSCSRRAQGASLTRNPAMSRKASRYGLAWLITP